MNLLIIDLLADQFKDKIEKNFPELNIVTGTKQNDIEKFIGHADILLTLGPPPFIYTDEIMSKAEKLKWIHSIYSGVDFLTHLNAIPKDVIITSSRGIHGPQVSELVFYFMLSFNRNFPRIYRNQQNRIWERWAPDNSADEVRAGILCNKTVCILGLGIIGKELSQKCKAFGMTVYGVARTDKLAHTVDHFSKLDGLPDVLKKVDFFVSILPSTAETFKMVGEKEFSLMQPNSIFINVGRGDTVDEEALVEALKKGKIGGAGLDCFFTEPLPTESPLWDMENVVMTPHIGGQCDAYVEQVLPIFEENLKRFVNDEQHNLINITER